MHSNIRFDKRLRYKVLGESALGAAMQAAAKAVKYFQAAPRNCQIDSAARGRGPPAGPAWGL